MWQVATNIIDGTNRDFSIDEILWSLYETKESCDKCRIIQGIHEDFYGFEDELNDDL